MIWIAIVRGVVCVAVRLFVKCFGPSNAITAAKFRAVLKQLQFELFVVFMKTREFGKGVTVGIVEEFDYIGDFCCVLGSRSRVNSVVVGLDGEVGTPVAVDLVGTNDDHQQSEQYQQACRLFRHEPAFGA